MRILRNVSHEVLRSFSGNTWTLPKITHSGSAEKNKKQKKYILQNYYINGGNCNKNGHTNSASYKTTNLIGSSQENDTQKMGNRRKSVEERSKQRKFSKVYNMLSVCNPESKRKLTLCGE